MPALTARRATWIAGLVACLVYANALGNAWAIDDTFIVRDNPAVHSVGAALGHFFDVYWPPQEGARAGLYRPLAIISYALDWALSGGKPWWFHLTNVALHGVVTALVVLVVWVWLPPAGALAAGVMFAVHPVHVEAVANVVGRTEIMTAGGVLLAVLAARRYRRADGTRAAWWFAGALGATFIALASKETGVVTIGVLVVDRWLDPERGRRDMLGLHLAVLALTIGWLFLWRAIAAVYADGTVAAGIRWLTTGERLATVVPAQLELVRLLVWPLRLSVDYSPLIIPRRTEWSVVATVAATTSTVILALAFAVARRAPAVTFGILVAAGSFLPTSSLLFPAGIVMAERTLYLAAVAPSCVVGWLLAGSGRIRHPREWRLLVAAAALVLVVFGVRTVTRTPIWRDTPTAVTRELLVYPQNYRAHVWLGDVFATSGDSVRAVRELLVATALFDDPFTTRLLIPLALARGAHRLALEESARAYELAPGHPEVSRFVMESHLASGQPDSAVSAMRHAIGVSPGNTMVNDDYLQLLERVEAPRWQRLFAQARTDWLSFRFTDVGPRLDTALTAASAAGDLGGFCWEVSATRAMIEALRPRLLGELSELAASRGTGCRFAPDP
jgi:hypothetical protein